MVKIETSVYEMAQRFTSVKEIGGDTDNPQILAFLKLDNSWPEHDEVPWCSGFANYICWLLRLPRSKSLRARSWLQVGTPIDIDDAELGDIVIFNRGNGPQNPDIIEAPGHVGFFAGLHRDEGVVSVLGGNQGDQVKVSRYLLDTLLGVRRIT